ncbi:hypothetical protein [Lentzea californiensis]|uniref:hypothetical protein n=1 Tax=Lentzea californiensis TaxID=438851 RepID=UPI0021669CB3|nr:hypothetical protein [Lentzea californiensis]
MDLLVQLREQAAAGDATAFWAWKNAVVAYRAMIGGGSDSRNLRNRCSSTMDSGTFLV